MKESPSADYPVRVRHQPLDEEAAVAAFYEGTYTVTLNRVVDIAFVPDVSASAPPWDGRQLPMYLDDVSTVEQARLAHVLGSLYAVTPNDTRAGTVERFRWPPEQVDNTPGVVRYVTGAEFARYADELAHLSTVAGGLYSDVTVSALRDYEVVRFLEREVVAAPWLGQSHAVLLGRDGSG